MKIDLREFCDKKNVRYELSTPFVRDGHLMATDTSVLIALQAPWMKASVGKIPCAEVALKPIRKIPVNDWKDWPEVCLVEVDPIPGCGDFSCQLVGNRLIDPKYDRIIRKLPGVQFAFVDKGRFGEIYFRFAGGVGALCAMERDIKKVPKKRKGKS